MKKERAVKVAPEMPKNTTETTPKFLEPAEVWALEKSRLLADLRRSELRVLALKRSRLDDQRVIFTSSAKDADAAISKEERAVLDNQDAEQKARVGLLEAIQKRLGLKSPAFGFNPDTLAVVEE